MTGRAAPSGPRGEPDGTGRLSWQTAPSFQPSQTASGQESTGETGASLVRLVPGSHGFLGAILTGGNPLPDGLGTAAVLGQL